MSKENKAVRAKKNILMILIIICALVFATSGYMLFDYVLENKEVEKKYDTLRQETATVETDLYEDMLPIYQDMYNKNSDFVAWLRVYNTKIDYPVMQTPNDEEYYIRRNFEKERSSAGCLFAAAHSNLDTPSDTITIYGHNMKIGSMFGKLREYEDPEYLIDHNYIRLDTLKQRFTYEICAVFKVSVAYDENMNIPFAYHSLIDFPGEDAYNEYMAKVKRYQLYDTGVPTQYGDKYILLSTCEYSRKEGRLVIMAKLVPNDQGPEFPKPEV